jgi:phosphoenolpyruvate phosphomutase
LGPILRAPEPAKVIGVYDALSARLAEQAGASALWASGLCMSAVQGLPDGELATYDTVIGRLAELRRGTSLPILADGNAGFGDEEVVAHLVTVMEDVGVQGVCLEDKAYPRRNSFARVSSDLAEPADFAAKVYAAVAARSVSTFLVVARVEALIAGLSMPEALARAALYSEAGADAIVIHSRAPTPDEVLEFARRWTRPVPLIVIPTTYPSLTVRQAQDVGIAAMIYANQLMRASMYAMRAFLDEAVKRDCLELCDVETVPLADALHAARGEDPSARVDDRTRSAFRQRFSVLRDHPWPVT